MTDSDSPDVLQIDMDSQKNVSRSVGFDQPHGILVLNETWWWAVNMLICSLALGANTLFLVTVIFNRKRQEIQTFVTAIIIAIAVLDVIDVIRVLPILVESLYLEEIFRHVYCSFGVFHELAVAMFIVSIGFAVCIQAGKETKFITMSSMSSASLPQKILIPLVLLLAASAAGPFFLLPYDRVFHTCIDPLRAQYITDVKSKHFREDFYATLVTFITYVLPILFAPIVIPLAAARTCIAKQCCIQRFKQPIGELIMVTLIYIIYLGTIVGVMIPRLDKLLYLENVTLGPAPLLWELGNNAFRPFCYFLTNPAVWEGLKFLCCKKKVDSNDSEARSGEEIEVPLNPITSV